jgi:hypothetical protein
MPPTVPLTSKSTVALIKTISHVPNCAIDIKVNSGFDKTISHAPNCDIDIKNKKDEYAECG